MVKPEINVTPMIDVLLVLLIIFMLVSNSAQARIEARIPDSPPDMPFDVKPNPDSLVFVVESEKSATLNNVRRYSIDTDLEKITDDLKEIFELRKEYEAAAGNPAGSQPSQTVMVKASKSIGYGSVVKVIDRIKASGAGIVGLQIDDLSE
ncbi:MAG: biopolymer transporter ExbD [Pyrinomonadaceae bacterium]